MEARGVTDNYLFAHPLCIPLIALPFEERGLELQQFKKRQGQAARIADSARSLALRLFQVVPPSTTRYPSLGGEMPAYVIVQIEVTDPAKYESYKQMVPPSIQKYGGRFLVRGDPVQTLEGTWSPKRFVIIQFDSTERAKAWWSSPEYRDAKLLRQASARTEMICVEHRE